MGRLHDGGFKLGCCNFCLVVTEMLELVNFWFNKVYYLLVCIGTCNRSEAAWRAFSEQNKVPAREPHYEAYLSKHMVVTCTYGYTSYAQDGGCGGLAAESTRMPQTGTQTSVVLLAAIKSLTRCCMNAVAYQGLEC